MELEIVWQEHELGSYPTIGLVWDDPMRDALELHVQMRSSAYSLREWRGIASRVVDAARSFGGRVERTLRSRQATARTARDPRRFREPERNITKLII
jgi:hypothetical protein